MLEHPNIVLSLLASAAMASNAASRGRLALSMLAQRPNCYSGKVMVDGMTPLLSFFAFFDFRKSEIQHAKKLIRKRLRLPVWAHVLK